MPFIPDTPTTTRTGFVPDKQTMGGFLGNVANSGGKFIGDTVGSVVNILNPNLEQNTLANLLKLGESIIEVALPGEQGNEEMARQLGQYYVQRYGGLDKAWNSFYNDPVGVAMDASVVLGGAGAAIKGVGAVSKVSGLTRAGEMASNASRLVDPLNATSRLISSSAGRITPKIAKALENASEKVVTRGIGNPVAQAKLAQKSGRSMADFMREYNLLDRNPETAAEVKKAILTKYDDLALNSGTSVPMEQIIKSFDDEISRLNKGVNGITSDATKARIEELINRKNQLLQASGATITPGDGFQMISGTPQNVPTATLTDFRRKVIDPDIPKSMFNLDARGSGTAQGTKATRDILRKTINSTDPALEKLGLDYGMAKGTEKILTDSASRANNRQLLNFSKLGGAGLGGIIHGAPGAVVGYAVEQIANNPQFIQAASKVLDSASNLVRRPLPTIPHAKQMYGVAKAARMVNLPIATNQQRKSPTIGDVLKTSPSSEIGTSPISKVNPSYSMNVAPSTDFVNAVVNEKQKTKALTYKPANVFKNKSAFGKVPKIKLSSAR